MCRTDFTASLSIVSPKLDFQLKYGCTAWTSVKVCIRPIYLFIGLIPGYATVGVKT